MLLSTAQRIQLPRAAASLLSLRLPSGRSCSRKTVLSRATDADKAASKRTEADANSKAEASGSKPQQSDSTDLDLPDYNQAIISTIGGKCASAIFIYVLTFGLAGFSNIDPYANLNLVSSDITTGAAAGVPVGLLFAAIFLLPIPKLPGTAVPQDVDLPDNYKGQSEVGLDSRQLKSMREVDDSEQPTSEILADISVVLPQDGDTIRRGLWWYSASVLKPWYPAFDSSTVRSIFAATCLTSAAQELLLRGYLAALLAGWWASTFSEATGPENALFWAKVLGIANADSPRWLAAGTLTLIQLLFCIPPARRSQLLVREGLEMLGMGMRIPGMKADVSATITVSSLAEAEAATRGSTGSSSNTGTVKTVRVGKGVNGDDEVKMAVEMEEAAPPTYEDQVVFGAGLACSSGIVIATNLAYALTGNLAASYAAQVVVDGFLTLAQQRAVSMQPIQVSMQEVVAEQAAARSDMEASQAAIRAALEESVKAYGKSTSSSNTDSTSDSDDGTGPGSSSGGSSKKEDSSSSEGSINTSSNSLGAQTEEKESPAHESGGGATISTSTISTVVNDGSDAKSSSWEEREASLAASRANQQRKKA